MKIESYDFFDFLSKDAYINKLTGKFSVVRRYERILLQSNKTYGYDTKSSTIQRVLRGILYSFGE